MIGREMEGFINNKECYFTDSFVKDASAGNGFDFKYYLRHGDNGNPCSIETACPVVNYWGTVYFRKPLKFRSQPDILRIASWGWQNWEICAQCGGPNNDVKGFGDLCEACAS